MFENILTKENVTFKDLEEIAFKIACEFANEILKNMLEEYDKQIMDSRDTSTNNISRSRWNNDIYTRKRQAKTNRKI